MDVNFWKLRPTRHKHKSKYISNMSLRYINRTMYDFKEHNYHLSIKQKQRNCVKLFVFICTLEICNLYFPLSPFSLPLWSRNLFCKQILFPLQERCKNVVLVSISVSKKIYLSVLPSKMLTTPISSRVNEDDDFNFVEIKVEPDSRGHPRPEQKSEVLQFLIHALGGCRSCRRICGPGASLWILSLHVQNLHPGDE